MREELLGSQASEVVSSQEQGLLNNDRHHCRGQSGGLMSGVMGCSPFFVQVKM